MSVEGREWAWSLDVAPAHFKVALALGDWCHKDKDTTWPSLASLVKRTRLARSTVCVALTALEDAGHITVWHAPGGGRTSSRYTLNLESNAMPVALVDNPESEDSTSPGIGLELVRDSDMTSPGIGLELVRGSDPDQYVSVLDQNPLREPAPIPPLTGLQKRRAGTIAKHYAAQELAARHGPPITHTHKWLITAQQTALAMPRLYTLMDLRPTAPPDSVASWLRGESLHTMGYFPEAM